MRFAVDVCALIKLLPPSEPGPTVRHQLAKCSTSVAMNYRSSRRARSHAEFTARMESLRTKQMKRWAGWSLLIARG
jgi:four helix bundle protein